MSDSPPVRPGSDPTISPSHRLVEQLAYRRGCDPIELESLYNRVDLEALDRLIEGSNGDLEVELTIDGDRATIGSDGSVSVR